VYHFDGIDRILHAQKIFGLFDSERLSDHVLLRHIQPKWRVPHSRWNDLAELDLTTCGYTILTKSADAGVDMFVKQFAKSLFVFIQSHPEYHVDTLMREYRRDITRYLNRQQHFYPKLPRNYFDHDVASQLEAIGNDVPNHSGGLTLLERAGMPDGWSATSVQLYSNWISYLLTMRG
jgi:homoserine O-succinyltransferase